MNIDITEFQGTNRFLSNFAPVQIYYKGYFFPTTENAYQACKSRDMRHMIQCQHVTPGVSKALGRTCTQRDDFDDIKIEIMTDINTLKYINPIYKQKLIETADMKIIEGNRWHDNFFGDCYCDKCKDIEGQNNLGKIIMDIRDRLIGG